MERMDLCKDKRTDSVGRADRGMDGGMDGWTAAVLQDEPLRARWKAACVDAGRVTQNQRKYSLMTNLTPIIQGEFSVREVKGGLKCVARTVIELDKARECSISIGKAMVRLGADTEFEEDRVVFLTHLLSF